MLVARVPAAHQTLSILRLLSQQATPMPAAAIARELFTQVKATEAPRTVAHILNVYLDRRLSKDETFLEFSRRVDIDTFHLEAKLEAAE